MYFRAKGARAQVLFPATNFLFFVAGIAQNPSLFFVNIMKDKLSKRKNVQLRQSISMFNSIYRHPVPIEKIAWGEKLEKSECWVVKWSSRNEGFEDKKEWEEW